MFSQGMPISDRTAFQSLLRITVTILSGFLVGPLIGTVLASFVYDGDLVTAIDNQSKDPSLITALMLMQGVSTLIGLIIFPVIHITLLERKPIQRLFENWSQMDRALVMIALLGLAFPIAMSPITEWNAYLTFPEFLGDFDEWAREMEDRLAKGTSLLTGFDTVGGLIVGLIVIAVLPAVGEELAFRGMIQKELWRGTGKIHLAIWVSSFVFSVIHVQFFGFFPRLLLGALFGYLYYWSGNLLVPMFAHFVNNAFGVVMRYLYNIKTITIDAEQPDAPPMVWVVPCALVSVVLLYQIRRLYLTSGNA